MPNNPPKQEILLPAKIGVILLSLTLALIFNLLPFSGTALLLRPDFVALGLLYWSINQPQKIGMGAAFVFGLLMDVANASVLGQHALAYSVMTFAALLFHRRMRMFGLRQQAAQAGLLLLVAQCVMLLTGLLAGASFPGLGYFLASATGALVWPPLSLLLRLPQHPKIDPDAL